MHTGAEHWDLKAKIFHPLWFFKIQERIVNTFLLKIIIKNQREEELL